MAGQKNSPLLPLVLFGILLMLQFGADSYKKFVKEQQGQQPKTSIPPRPSIPAKPSAYHPFSAQEFYKLPSPHRLAIQGLPNDFKVESASFAEGHQAYLNQLDFRHRTPLIVALLAKKFDFVRMLLDLGADVHIADEGGNSPLLIALVHGTDELASEIILKGGDFLAPNKDGLTPLHASAKHGRVRMAAFLIEHGSPINAVFANGWTPLHYAAMNGYPEIVTMLLEKGADVSARLSYGWRPLDLAQAQKHPDCIRAFSRFAEQPVIHPTNVPAEMKFPPPQSEEKAP